MKLFQGLLKRSNREEKGLSKKLIKERSSPSPDYSILRKVLLENKGIVTEVFSLEENDIIGLKSLIVMFPSLATDYANIPKHIMNVVLQEKGHFDESEYDSWISGFFERVSNSMSKKRYRYREGCSK